MINTIPAPPTLITDIWVPTTWEEFQALWDRPELEQARFYYDDGWMRVETMPIGSAHGQDNSILAAIIRLYGTLRDLNYVAFTNSSFRKQGERDCQPDLAYYMGTHVQRPPKNHQPIDVDRYGAPTLAIEISATTLSNDLGQKRLLYERLGVEEYWVVNVEVAMVIAFAIADGGSKRIQASSVLPNLPISVIEEVLRRSQTEDDGTLNRWLLQQFS